MESLSAAERSTAWTPGAAGAICTCGEAGWSGTGKTMAGSHVASSTGAAGGNAMAQESVRVAQDHESMVR